MFLWRVGSRQVVLVASYAMFFAGLQLSERCVRGFHCRKRSLLLVGRHSSQ